MPPPFSDNVLSEVPNKTTNRIREVKRGTENTPGENDKARRWDNLDEFAIKINFVIENTYSYVYGNVNNEEKVNIRHTYIDL